MKISRRNISSGMIKGKNINRNKTEIPIEDIKFEKNIDFLKQDNLRLNSFYKVIFDKYINGVSNNE